MQKTFPGKNLLVVELWYHVVNQFLCLKLLALSGKFAITEGKL